MKHYYSILKICPNVDLDDSISIGLIVLSGNDVWFKYSAALLRKVKRFIREDSNYIEPVLKQIARKVSALNDSQDDNTLFLDKGVVFTESLLAHFAIMHNNILRFSQPNPIQLEEDGENAYLQLYERLLHIPADEGKSKKSNSKSYELVKKELIKPLIGKIHTEIKLSSDVVPTLYFNLTVDCIGKNGSLVAAKYIDFEQSKQTVDRHLTHFRILMDHISREYSAGSPDVFVLGKEPSLNSETHDMWNFAHNSEVYTLKHPDQSIDVREFILDKKASKFLDF